jgi:hypothetical protein
MMRLPLACPKCGSTEPTEPVKADVYVAGTVYPLTVLDPVNRPCCWDTVKNSEYALPHVNGEPIPRPTGKQGPVAVSQADA